MDHQLVVLRGRSVTSAVKLADGVTTAGRQEDCQLRIKSSQVSRKHCQFFEKNGMLIVKDLGSSNGTFVNSERIEGQRVLEPGDEVAIGPISFRVEKIGVVSAPKAAPVTSAKPGDTAITKGVATKEAVPDDEFEIIFDEEPAAVETVSLSDEAFEAVPPPAKTAPVENKGAASLASARKTEPAPAPKTAPPPPPAAEPDFADDAVADFLLDLKVDDDD